VRSAFHQAHHVYVNCSLFLYMPPDIMLCIAAHSIRDVCSLCVFIFSPIIFQGLGRWARLVPQRSLFVGLNRCGPVQVPLVPGSTGVPCWGLWGKPPVGLGPSLGCPADLCSLCLCVRAAVGLICAWLACCIATCRTCRLSFNS